MSDLIFAVYSDMSLIGFPLFLALFWASKMNKKDWLAAGYDNGWKACQKEANRYEEAWKKVDGQKH